MMTETAEAMQKVLQLVATRDVGDGGPLAPGAEERAMKAAVSAHDPVTGESMYEKVQRQAATDVARSLGVPSVYLDVPESFKKGKLRGKSAGTPIIDDIDSLIDKVRIDRSDIFEARLREVVDALEKLTFHITNYGPLAPPKVEVTGVDKDSWGRLVKAVQDAKATLRGKLP